MAYSMALRQWMLSNGFTVGLIEVYQRRAIVGLSVFAFSDGSLSTRASAAGCAPVPATSRSRSPAMIRLSMSSALTFSETSYSSGSALRWSSVLGSHWSLRTSLNDLPGCRSWNL